MAWEQTIVRDASRGNDDSGRGGQRSGHARRGTWRIGGWLAAGLLAAGLVVGPARAAEPIAESEADQPGLRLQLQELKRTSGGTLMLRFTLVNDGEKALNFGSHFLGDHSVGEDYRTVGGIHLIDAAGKKKYLVVRDSQGKCVCSKDMPNLEPGNQMSLWARFPAPPENVEKISVIVPHFIPMDDVPIGR